MELKLLHKRVPGRHLQIAAYARISNDKEILETSLKEQMDYYTRLILDNPNWDLVGIFYDDGISGTTIEKRDGFKRMLDLAFNGQIDIIFVKSISRFARNVVDSLETIRKLRNIGVEVYFEQQSLSSLDVKCDVAFSMYSEFAEAEAISTSSNVKWRVNKNINDGKYTLPVNQMLGYQYDLNGNLYIVEKEAKIIRLIYSLYLDGKGSGAIAEYLKENKYKNKRGYKWNPSTIRYILRNEKYVGDVLFQKRYIEDPLTHKEKINHGERDMYLLENAHPAIIPRDMWNAVQNKMNEAIEKFKIATYENGKFTEDKISPTRYSNFAICPYCGNSYNHKINHYKGMATTRFLICALNKQGKLCKSENYPVEELNKIMASLIKSIKVNLPLFKSELTNAFTDTKASDVEESISEIDIKIKELKSKYRKAIHDEDELIQKTGSALASTITELSIEKSKLIHELSTINNPKEEINKIIASLDDLPTEADKIENSNFKDFFSKCIIVNKELIYFIIGNKNVVKPSTKPKGLLFTGTHSYIVRKTEFKTKYGIIISK